MLTDTHCHIDVEKFSADREAVLGRAWQSDVGRILVPGLSLSNSEAVLRLVEDESKLFAAVGVHPTEAAKLSHAGILELGELALHPKVKAIGEIGLDYYWDACPHKEQQTALRAQLDLASNLSLPVVIHFREKGDTPEGSCVNDLLEILGDWIDALISTGNSLADHPGVLHSFSGTIQAAEKAIDLGFLLGVTGPVTYNKSRQALISEIPMEKLLLETDAPYMAPAPHRGKRNEPANVRLIADKIALLHSCSLEECASLTSANAARLFNWD